MALVLLLYLPFALSMEWWEESKSPLLNNESIQRVVGGEKYLLVEFFTPWCHYCHLMFPEFEQFYHIFQDPDSSDYREDLIVARVNAGANQNLAIDFDVYAFPTILVWEPRNKEYKHRVEGYQRRYDLTRLALHALPEKPTLRIPTQSPEPSRPQMVRIDPQSFRSPELVREPPPFPPPPPPPPPDQANIDPPNDLLTDEDPEIEYEIVYRDSAAAIKEELNSTYHRLVDVIETGKSGTTELIAGVVETLKEMKAAQREERLRDAERFEKLEARLEEVHLDIKQRNRLESAQTRLNLTHMMLFLVIGAMIGAALSLLASKLSDPSKSRSKV